MDLAASGHPRHDDSPARRRYRSSSLDLPCTYDCGDSAGTRCNAPGPRRLEANLPYSAPARLSGDTGLNRLQPADGKLLHEVTSLTVEAIERKVSAGRAFDKYLPVRWQVVSTSMAGNVHDESRNVREDDRVPIEPMLERTNGHE
jgi:hypothetical protein